MNDNRLRLQRVRNLGEVISDSFAFQMPNWRTFAAVAGPAVMVGILLQLLVYLLIPEPPSGTLTDAQQREYAEDAMEALAPLLVLLPIMWVIYQLTTAGIVVLLKALGDAQPVSAGDALDAAQDRVKDLLLASLKSTFLLMVLALVGIGMPMAFYALIDVPFLLVLPVFVAGIGLFLRYMVRWALIVQGIMLDGVSHREALLHSAGLVDGAWWYTFGRLIVAALVIGIPGSVATSIISGIIPGVAGILLAGCVGFLTYPYPIIATTLIFFDRKARKAEAPDVAAGL